ncbi:restriction endonuclease subunit R [Wenyingzhuangia fucanilytica]|uniref:Restriction endonuclease subunit R n=1 Tax=Wenyingzhuangia fucanilytica TaxID=1790137 RepID=A0A1B1Y564_9FLAO|nr:DUF3427 domain-containing protein [Wenyingzhuangia fucanilytica]ANW95912.1 restriction endonuclease subunit R [Wenyingzhuangia fucanilytica]
MNKFSIQGFEKSIQTGFIDKTINSEILYQPELLVNRKKPKVKVLSTIINELESCESFFISVAFVTTGGVATLMNTLVALEKRNIKGKILVSQYLNFTQPEALKRLLKFKNIELRIATKENSHSKGYLFKTADYYNLIIGSSNLTDSALTTNKEWNLKVSALYDSEIVDKVVGEFEDDFNKGIVVTSEFIEEYKEVYNKQRLYSTKGDDEHITTKTISPNSMQKEALKNIEVLRLANKNKALLISATGTGKTYLSAFDAKAFNSKKLLFVVHRLNIAKKALETFQSVFGQTKTMGLYSGNHKDLDKDFIFSTVQTISRENHLHQFDKDLFDYIIIDESHRSGAESYLRLIEYFTPKFLLGMTATPERTDGNDIFSLFDHNIAYEIRLNRAMEENMLSPFHYYGVTDLSINDELIENKSDFNLLAADERVDKIIEKAHLYGCDNGIVRGLVFCSSNKEARILSLKFNERKYKTIALSGDNSEDERIRAIELLESDNINEKIDYIFTVDIFNEGIDIPKVNQIIMMRPTDSSIIFIQQLGRGLRKINEKHYLTIIDFIGNYTNNYLIPIALYGDTSYNKDTLRKLLSEGSREIPGTSTINFDEISKEKIFKSIDNAKMDRLADLRKDYELLKFKLGRIPMMMDFVKHGSRDPYLYVDYSKSYLNFVNKVEKDYKHTLSNKSVKLLELFSKEINNAKRITESILLKELIENHKITYDNFINLINYTYGFEISKETLNSTISNINFEFIRDKKDKKLIAVKDIYNLKIVYVENETIFLEDEFLQLIQEDIFNSYLIDSIKLSIDTFNNKFKIEDWKDGFILYQKYSRKDVFRILNTPENPVAQNVGGYLVSADYKNCPIFLNYNKEEDISESTKYEDKFVNNKELEYMSKSNRKLTSKDVKSILGVQGDIRLPLFTKKSNDEGSEFYYLGDIYLNKEKVEQTRTSDGKPIIKFNFLLEHPVPDNLYRYITTTVDTNLLELPKAVIEKNIVKEEKPIFTIPFYDFYAAAGSFSEMQVDKDYSMLEVDTDYNNQNVFACKVLGESMNKIIPNNSICLFKEYSGGSRNGKIVLVENVDFQNTEFNSAFTVKTYVSEKIVTEDGWGHTAIYLKPNSYDSNFKDIIINEENGQNMRVVGEFVKVLES